MLLHTRKGVSKNICPPSRVGGKDTLESNEKLEVIPALAGVAQWTERLPAD